MLGTVVLIAIVFIFFNFKRIIKYSIYAFLMLSFVSSVISFFTGTISTILDYFI